MAPSQPGWSGSTYRCVDEQSPACCVENLNAKKLELEAKLAKQKAIKEGKIDASNADEDRRAIDVFFEQQVHGFVVRWRTPLFIAFGIFVLIFLVFSTQLQPDPSPPQFFPDGNIK